MIEFIELFYHIRVHRDPPFGLRVAFGLIAGAMSVGILGALVRYFDAAPIPVGALMAVFLRRRPESVRWTSYLAIGIAGMLVGALLEAFVYIGEQLSDHPAVVLSEITTVDILASLLVIVLVFGAGLIAMRVDDRRVPNWRSRAMILWLILAILLVGLTLWLLLIIYEVLGIAGVL